LAFKACSIFREMVAFFILADSTTPCL
jgi:hypothetical protein